MDILSAAFDAVFQLAVFSLIPLIWWLVTARKKENFFRWIGLKPVSGSWGVAILWILVFFALCAVSQVWVVPSLLPPGVTAQSTYAGMGWAALPDAALFGMVQTGLAEEIVFRGFLGKRLIAKLGFQWGNLIQGLLFGALHGVMFFFVTSLIKALGILLLTGFSGWLLGLMNEKYAGGSILPSWLAHGLGNVILSMVEAFGGL